MYSMKYADIIEIELIKKIIETGTEEEKHEAKLLYMQIK